MLALGMARNKKGFWVTRLFEKYHDTIEQISGYQSNFDHWPKV